MTPSLHSCLCWVPSLRASTPHWDIGRLCGTFPKESGVSSSAGPPRLLPASAGGALEPSKWGHGPTSTAHRMAHGRCSVCIYISMHTEVLCLASVVSLKRPIPACCHSLCLDSGDTPRSGLAPFRPSVRPSRYSELSGAPIRTATAMGREPSVNVYTGVLESRAGLTPGEGFLVPRWALGSAGTLIPLRARIEAADECGGNNMSVEAQCWDGGASL